MSSMRKAVLFLIPTLLGTAAFASTQSGKLNLAPRAAPEIQLAQAASVRSPVQAAQPRATADVSYALADWRRLRQGGNYSFNDYARFLIYNVGWPDEPAMRRAAERSMRPGESPATVLAFFAAKPPQSGNGHARLAEALSASGRHNEAIAAAKSAWAAPDLGGTNETALYARFGGYLNWQDHERRADALLFDKQPREAYRFLGLTTPARRPVFSARIAMQTRAPDSENHWRSVAHRAGADAGLLMDRLRYLRDGGNEAAAHWLAAQPHNFTERPADPDRFFEMLLLVARSAADARQWVTAHNIARQVDDAFPAGTDMTAQSYGVRDKYTSLTWLAGTAAHSAGRPADAIGQFVRYANGGKSLQVTTKGYYWAGQAAMAAGRAAEASNYFNRAAFYPELFYGQLALERMGRPVPAPPAMPMQAVTSAQRQAFHANSLVRATRQLGQQGRRDEQALFVRALAESLNTDQQRILATELAQHIHRQDLAVWTARASRNNGSPFYVLQAFPTHASGVPGVPGGRLWSLTHGITRQESSFDMSAVSHAGARGMMQLMLPTAREQAGKMGVPYNAGRLTSDPNYNVMLGSAYFSRMLNMWDGNVPLAVASYNAGAGNVRKWVRQYGDPRRPGADVLGWIEQIPFMETRGYVQRVIENSVVYDRINPSPSTQTAFHVSSFLGKNAPG